MPRRKTSRLTDAFIRSLKPREKRYDVYDAQLAGFGIRVSPLGTKSWIVLSRNNQRKTRVTLGRYPQMLLNTARQYALVITEGFTAVTLDPDLPLRLLSSDH